MGPVWHIVPEMCTQLHDIGLKTRPAVQTFFAGFLGWVGPEAHLQKYAMQDARCKMKNKKTRRLLGSIKA